jgi:CRP-like cAMP-binding protein
MPGDIILKQGQRNQTFYYIHSGLVEVIQEKLDFVYFNHKEVEMFINQKTDERQQVEESQEKIKLIRNSRIKVS